MDYFSVLRTRNYLTPAEDSILLNLPERWLSLLFPPKTQAIDWEELETVNSYQKRLARGSKARIVCAK